MGGKKRKKTGEKGGAKVKPGPKNCSKTGSRDTRRFRKFDKENKQLKRKPGKSEPVVPEKVAKTDKPLNCVSNFHLATQDVPNNVCVSCGGLFYRFSVNVRSVEWIQEKLLGFKSKVSAQECADYIDSLLDKDLFYLCDYCQRTVVGGKLPVLSIYNGLGFPDVPPIVAELTDLQEKLVAPRVEFARIQKVGKGGQKGILGNIVNVAHDINTSVKVIPRRFHEVSVVNVEFMRRSQYNIPYAKERISPLEVLMAAKYLVDTPVYKDLGVKLSDEWDRERIGEYLEVPTVYVDKSKKVHRPDHSSQVTKTFAISVGSDDDDDSDGSDGSDDDDDSDVNASKPCEDGFSEAPSTSKRCSPGVNNSDSDENQTEEKRSPFRKGSSAISENDSEDDSGGEGIQNWSNQASTSVVSHSNARFFSENQTLLIDLNSAVSTVRFAPCENESPIPLYIDKNPDILAFPSVYGGQWRNFKLKSKPSIKKIKKFELRYHKRPPRLVLHLFQGFKMCFNCDIQNCIRVLLRKQAGDKNLTASEAMNTDVLKSIFTEDRGYSAFKQVRCTPAYWQAQGKKAVAMGRQFGKATFFITLSAAENHWADLIVALLDVVKQVKVCYADVRKWLESEDCDKPDIGLSWGLIYDLISADPATCVRHFDRRFRCFQKYVLNPIDGVFSTHLLEDFFWRVEFQQRGSPHLHGVTWNTNAPILDIEDPDSFQNCVDFVDCYITTVRSSDPKLKHVMPYQIHRHSFTCRKNCKSECRFGFPRPPFPKTMILLPLDGDSVRRTKTARTNFERIQGFCNELGRDFSEDMAFGEFLDKLQMSFGDYIQAVRSSIVRPTAFLRRDVNAAWVNNYNETMLLSWEANMDIQYVIDGFATMRYIVGYMLKCENRLSKVLSKIMKSYQVGDISGYDKVKQFANAMTDGQCITAQEASQYVLSLPCVYTSRSEIYINNNKPLERIRMLKRKSELEKLDPDSENVLASNVIVRYAYRPKELEDICLVEFAGFYELDKRNSNNCDIAGVDGDIDWHLDEDCAIADVSKCKGKRYILQNNMGKVYRRSKCKVVRFRRYNRVSQTEDYIRSEVFLYHPWRDEQQEVWSLIPENLTKEMEENINQNRKLVYKNDYAENIGDILKNICDDEDLSYAGTFDDEYGINIQNEFETNEFGGADMVREKSTREFELFDEKKYRETMRSLNSKQRFLVLEIITRLKSFEVHKEPFRVFLNGGAGVGKSHAIHAILQTYKRYQMKLPSEDPDKEWVIVAAYTGKAAFNIGGVTLHSVFRFPKNVKHSVIVEQLQPETENQLRNRFSELKLVIIDEISFVSNYMLNMINARLKQIKGNNLDFGGVCMLVVGDLRQLQPVLAPYVFETFVPLSDTAKKQRGYLSRDVTINHLWGRFEYYKLTEIMRQKGDVNFIKALNNMAVGRMTAADIKLIQSREVDDEEIPFDAVRLFHSRADCHKYNRRVYGSLKTEGVDSVAFDEVNGRVGPAQVKSSKEFAKNMNAHQSDGIPYLVHLKVGATYFITTNVDVSDGLFNGSTGILKLIQYAQDSTHGRIPIRVWIAFDNCSVGKKARMNYNKVVPVGVEKEWTPIERIHRNLSREKLHMNAQIVRHQFPLEGANGMTIHKSQGSTLELVSVSYRSRLTRQLGYVACSRATSLKGLFIQDGAFREPSAASEHDKVEVELRHLKSVPFVPSIRIFPMNVNVTKVFFANITSFKPVVQDLEADSYLMECDLMLFVEPRILNSDSVALKGYEIVTRVNCRSSRNSEGVLCFRAGRLNRDSIAFEDIYQNYEENGHFMVAHWRLYSFHLYVFYKSPGYSLSKCKQYILTISRNSVQKALIIGDINWNLGYNMEPYEGAKSEFLDALKSAGYTSLIPLSKPSTDSGSTIDVAFSNIEAFVQA